MKSYEEVMKVYDEEKVERKLRDNRKCYLDYLESSIND